MKLKLNQMISIVGGSVTRTSSVGLSPIPGAEEFLFGRTIDNCWVISTRDGKYKVFPNEIDARKFIFCLELTSSMESLGLDTSSMKNRLIGFLSQPFRFVGAQ